MRQDGPDECLVSVALAQITYFTALLLLVTPFLCWVSQVNPQNQSLLNHKQTYTNIRQKCPMVVPSVLPIGLRMLCNKVVIQTYVIPHHSLTEMKVNCEWSCLLAYHGFQAFHLVCVCVCVGGGGFLCVCVWGGGGGLMQQKI